MAIAGYAFSGTELIEVLEEMHSRWFGVGAEEIPVEAEEGHDQEERRDGEALSIEKFILRDLVLRQVRSRDEQCLFSGVLH